MTSPRKCLRASGSQARSASALLSGTKCDSTSVLTPASCARRPTSSTGVWLSRMCLATERAFDAAAPACVSGYTTSYADAAASNARSVAKHILESHTPVEEVGRLAQEAGVKTLVLSHFVPDNNADAERAWLPLARKHFRGEVIVGRDLLEI